MKNKQTIGINIIFILVVLLILLDVFTSFEIKAQWIKSVCYIGILLLAPITLVWNFGTYTTLKKRILTMTLPVLVLLGILLVGPSRIVSSTGTWNTQTILYQNSDQNAKKIEFQMQDVGARGYNKRTVVVTYLTPLFMIISPAPQNIDANRVWLKVDIDVNEIGLKYP